MYLQLKVKSPSLTMHLTPFTLYHTPIFLPWGYQLTVVCVYEGFFFIFFAHLLFSVLYSTMCKILWFLKFCVWLFCLAWYSQSPPMLLQMQPFVTWPSSYYQSHFPQLFSCVCFSMLIRNYVSFSIKYSWCKISNPNPKIHYVSKICCQ